ncbi:hypothetical protein [Streptomyces rubellomurinus]|uniref:Uncharacterized protein n=1 Tax=Streptomyces rubellomurinus (strain ATCC 31215) TaxID=359131 RepID=A0A0F2TLX2_STRR3|nr:hypothetical protein [Streptomyces rubellomurinus]KJS63290.1 hypothetical protein VM95_03455 [Streptomyces rubellomurinus]
MSGTQHHAPTAHVVVGYTPQEGFVAVQLSPPPAEYVWHDRQAEHDRERFGPGNGYQQWLAVDLRTGAVWFGDTDWRTRDEEAAPRLPGHRRAEVGDGALPCPAVFAHPLPHRTTDERGGETWRFFTAEELYALARRILPLVQRVIGSLHRVGPAADLEWSAEAATAWSDLEEACRHTLDATGTPVWPVPRMSPVPGWRVEVAGFLARNPELCDPAWATATDAELDAYAAYEPDSGYGGVPGRVCAPAGVRIEEGYAFYGHRAALYACRAAACGDRTPVEAGVWLHTSDAGRSSWEGAKVVGASLADATDCVLDHLAETFRRAAADDGVVLTGLTAHLRQQRAEERTAIDETLAATGEELKRLEELLKEIRLVRNTVLTRVLSWTDGRDDEAIARLASLSPAAVAEWRERLTADRSDPTEG